MKGRNGEVLSSSQASLAWLYAKAKELEVTVVPIFGTTDKAHARHNIKATGVELTELDVKKMDRLSRRIKGKRGDEVYLSVCFEAVQAKNATAEPGEGKKRGISDVVDLVSF